MILFIACHITRDIPKISFVMLFLKEASLQSETYNTRHKLLAIFPQILHRHLYICRAVKSISRNHPGKNRCVWMKDEDADHKTARMAISLEDFFLDDDIRPYSTRDTKEHIRRLGWERLDYKGHSETDLKRPSCIRRLNVQSWIPHRRIADLRPNSIEDPNCTWVWFTSNLPSRVRCPTIGTVLKFRDWGALSSDHS
ncbi:hypothetical protein AVEN_212936-1 [Araneus ventricosus]|uniref:Uncharacterized protein n=1 Tax=Araneus ventricosus TaxID=182803 RepID=A0A4Y2I131_ARAVE|nr:hypothetical protein AVEN_212936-1 [Araneus ventricosus]